jgi:hypothetical protein
MPTQLPASPFADLSRPVKRLSVNPLNDDPLPLFLTTPAPEMDRELSAMLRAEFGVRA